MPISSSLQPMKGAYYKFHFTLGELSDNVQIPITQHDAKLSRRRFDQLAQMAPIAIIK
jgi:hypothetical protein